MKKQTLYCIAVSVLFLFIGRGPALAQSEEYVMTVQVPFEFQVNGRLLPAGKYVIRRFAQDPLILLIQCPEQKIWATVHTIPHSLSEPSPRTSLIFYEYGEKHFLSEVRVLGQGEGYAIETRAERRM